MEKKYKMKKIKFQRRTGERFSKFGKKRKKKQVWRRPTGRDNKMREKRRGYPFVVSIGYKKKKQKENNIKINNLIDLEKVDKGKTILVGKIGKKKKIELLESAKKKGIKVYRTNIEKFIKKNLKKSLTTSNEEKDKKNQNQKRKLQKVKNEFKKEKSNRFENFKGWKIKNKIFKTTFRRN